MTAIRYAVSPADPLVLALRLAARRSPLGAAARIDRLLAAPHDAAGPQVVADLFVLQTEVLLQCGHGLHVE